MFLVPTLRMGGKELGAGDTKFGFELNRRNGFAPSTCPRSQRGKQNDTRFTREPILVDGTTDSARCEWYAL